MNAMAQRHVLVGLALIACASPEARRVRDGGAGADPGNKRLADGPMGRPVAADTTLWPGKAPAPTERLAAGTMYVPASALPIPAGPTSAAGSTDAKTSAGSTAQVITPTTASPREGRAFNKGTSANPRSPSSSKP
ncbi:MAG: hypothetical protein NVSMB22_22130 [Chloroflexota bacterium]